MSQVPVHEEAPEMLQRREVLRRVAWLIGGAVSAPAALAILQGCSAKDAPEAAAWTPKFFSGKQKDVVTAIADSILPKSKDYSGALDANVPAFIDAMLADVYDDAARKRFNDGFAQFDAGFLERDAAGKTTAVKTALESALAAENADGKPFILMTRELTLLGFYTSRPGILENMMYAQSPGPFHGCVPVAQMEKPVYYE